MRLKHLVSFVILSLSAVWAAASASHDLPEIMPPTLAPVLEALQSGHWVDTTRIQNIPDAHMTDDLEKTPALLYVLTVKNRTDEATETLIRQNAEKPEATAFDHFVLGTLYESQNMNEEAEQHYRVASKKHVIPDASVHNLGIMWAKSSLALFYIDNYINDHTRARKLVKLLKPAKDGFPEAQYLQGLLYATPLAGHPFLNKTQFKNNFIKSKDWLEKAGNQGHIKAQYLIGQCSLNGLARFPKSETFYNMLPEEGAAWLRRAAENGVIQAGAFLGEMYYWGRLCGGGRQIGFRWFIWAAERGDLEAKNWLGVHCSENILECDGTSYYDPQKARAYFQEAADQGCRNAQFNLGVLAKDEAEKKKFFDLALEGLTVSRGGISARSLLVKKYSIMYTYGRADFSDLCVFPRTPKKLSEKVLELYEFKTDFSFR